MLLSRGRVVLEDMGVVSALGWGSPLQAVPLSLALPTKGAGTGEGPG